MQSFIKVFVLALFALGIALAESDYQYEELDFAGGFCVSDANCGINERCVKSGSGAGYCVEKPIVGECRENSDCDWPKRCIGWYCR